MSIKMKYFAPQLVDLSLQNSKGQCADGSVNNDGPAPGCKDGGINTRLSCLSGGTALSSGCTNGTVPNTCTDGTAG
jgi:hypothetical protein